MCVCVCWVGIIHLVVLCFNNSKHILFYHWVCFTLTWKNQILSHQNCYGRKKKTICCVKWSLWWECRSHVHTHHCEWSMSPTLRRATPAWRRLAVVRFNFCTDGQQIVEASEWTSRVTGRKTHTAALSLIIKSVCKKFPGINFWPLQCQKNRWWPTMNLHLSSWDIRLRVFPNFISVLFLYIIYMHTAYYDSIFIFNTIIPFQCHLGEINCFDGHNSYI